MRISVLFSLTAGANVSEIAETPLKTYQDRIHTAKKDLFSITCIFQVTPSSGSPRRTMDGPFGDTYSLMMMVRTLVDYYELSKTVDELYTVIGKAFSYGCWCQIRAPFRDEWYTILGKTNNFYCGQDPNHDLATSIWSKGSSDTVKA